MMHTGILQAKRIRTWPWFVALAGLLLWPLLPGVGENPYYLHLSTIVCIYMILALGLNITIGFAGLLDLGFAAFYGIGAYTYAVFATMENPLPFWVIVAVAVAVTLLIRFLVGASCLRLKGDYLAIVTLGFGEITRTVINNNPFNLTGGTFGLSGIPAPDLGFYRIDPTNPLSHYWYYYLAAGFVIFFVYASIRMKYSRLGRAWIALREDEVAAEAMGVDVFSTKLYAYVLGAVGAAVAGCLFAAKQRFVSPESFAFFESVLLVCMVVLGGLGSVRGALVGAVVLILLPELPRLFPEAVSLLPEPLQDMERYRMLLFGLALLLVMLFRPQGLVGSSKRYAELHPAMERDARREDASLDGIRDGKERF